MDMYGSLKFRPQEKMMRDQKGKFRKVKIM